MRGAATLAALSVIIGASAGCLDSQSDESVRLDDTLAEDVSDFLLAYVTYGDIMSRQVPVLDLRQPRVGAVFQGLAREARLDRVELICPNGVPMNLADWVARVTEDAGETWQADAAAGPFAILAADAPLSEQVLEALRDPMSTCICETECSLCPDGLTFCQTRCPPHCNFVGPGGWVTPNGGGGGGGLTGDDTGDDCPGLVPLSPTGGGDPGNVDPSPLDDWLGQPPPGGDAGSQSGGSLPSGGGADDAMPAGGSGGSGSNGAWAGNDGGSSGSDSGGGSGWSGGSSGGSSGGGSGGSSGGSSSGGSSGGSAGNPGW